MIKEFKDKIPSQESKKEDLEIEVSKSDYDLFKFTTEVFDEAYDRLVDRSDKKESEILDISLDPDSENIKKYLNENKDSLSEEAKFFLRTIVEKREVENKLKDRDREEKKEEEEVVLRGEEAEKFIRFQKLREFDPSKE